MDIEQVKKNIRQMLDIAGNEGAAAGEIESALRFANRLMEKHQLTEEDLPKAEQKIVDLENAAFKTMSAFCIGDKSFQSWHELAAHFTCEFVGGVKWYYRKNEVQRDEHGIVITNSNGKLKTKTLITFYGIEEDVEIAVAVFDQLLLTVVTMAKLRFGVVYRPGPGRSYCNGFIDGIYHKFHKDKAEQRQKALTANATGTALMVIDQRQAIIARKEALAKDWLANKAGVKTRKGTGASRRYGKVDGEAYNSGKEDGQKYTAGGERKKRLT